MYKSKFNKNVNYLNKIHGDMINSEEKCLNSRNKSILMKTVKLTVLTSLIFIIFLILRHRMILRKTYEEQKMSMFSETAFYYSFYEDLINSPEKDILNLIMEKFVYDTRSEYPDIINSISRFNIYQEIILGILYRLFTNVSFRIKYLYLIVNSMISGNSYYFDAYSNHLNYNFNDQISLISPFNFYYYSVNIILGIGMGILCGTSTYIADGSYLSGMACMGFLFSNFQMRLLSRISSLPLRENFALPFIWVNIMILIYILKEKNNNALNKSWFYFYISSLILLEFWQFSVFVITTQITSIYLIYLIGYEHLNLELKLTKLILIHLFAVLSSYLLHFFNNYILLTPLPQIGSSILITLMINSFIRNFKSDSKHSIFRSFLLGVISLTIFIFIRYILHPFLNHDTHVFDMLKSAIFGGNYLNFDTMIYKMGGSEFSWITKQQLLMIKNSNVLYFFLPNLVLILICIFTDALIINYLNYNKKSLLNNDDYNRFQYEEILADDNNSVYSFSSNSSINSSSTSSSPKSTTTSLYDWKSCFEYNSEKDISLKSNKKEILKIENKTNILCENPNIQSEQEFHNQDISIVYLTFQTISFCLLAIIISRLRVLALPYISVFASLLASISYVKHLLNYYYGLFFRIFKKTSTCEKSADFEKSRRSNFNIRYIFKKLFFLSISTLVLSCAIYKFPINEFKSGLMPENNATSAKSRLIEWINSNLPQGTPILADMVISATLRLMTNAKLVTHPQYEHIKIRKRTQFIYSISACIPLKELYETMKDVYNTEYLLLTIYRCAVPSNDQNIISIIQVTDYLENLKHRCNNQEHLFQRTCWRIQLDNYSRYFDLVYRNAHYSIYKRRKETESNFLNNNIYENYDNLNNYSQFPFRRRLLDWDETWKPWIINHCIINDEYCPENIVDYARTIIDIYNLIEVSALIYEKAIFLYINNPYVLYNYAEFLDYDFGGDSTQVMSYYNKSFELLKLGFSNKHRYIEKSDLKLTNKNLNKIPNVGFVLKMIMGIILYKDQIEGRNNETIISSLKLILENEFIKTFVVNFGSLSEKELINYLHIHKIIDINYDMCLVNFAYNICMVSSYLKTLEKQNFKILSLQNKYPVWLIQTVCKNLWLFANLIDPNNTCVIKYWSLFNEGEKKSVDYLYSFFLS